ncbi:MAG: hypothetical protein MRY32_07870 [Rickettsiales bacterium]|nr:hypothetical protein [Rickettsiales bacterium]
MTDITEIDELFEQYLHICNQAMEQNKDQFPYKHIWEAVERFKQGEDIDLTIYDDEPKSHYKVQLKDKHIDIVDVDHDDEHKGWKINTSYLRRVIAQPDEYINHPAKLDWDWLKDRAGL